MNVPILVIGVAASVLGAFLFQYRAKYARYTNRQRAASPLAGRLTVPSTPGFTGVVAVFLVVFGVIAVVLAFNDN